MILYDYESIPLASNYWAGYVRQRLLASNTRLYTTNQNNFESKTTHEQMSLHKSFNAKIVRLDKYISVLRTPAKKFILKFPMKYKQNSLVETHACASKKFVQYKVFSKTRAENFSLKPQKSIKTSQRCYKHYSSANIFVFSNSEFKRQVQCFFAKSGKFMNIEVFSNQVFPKCFFFCSCAVNLGEYLSIFLSVEVKAVTNFEFFQKFLPGLCWTC